MGAADAAVPLPVVRLDAVVFDSRLDRGAEPSEATPLVKRLVELGIDTALLRHRRRGGPGRNAPAPDVKGLFTLVLDVPDSEDGVPPDEPDRLGLLHLVDSLRVHPGRAAVVSCAVAGMEAACRCGFGFVVGVSRARGQVRAMRARGTVAVVADLDAAGVDEPTVINHRKGATAGAWLLDYRGVDPSTEGVRETLCALGTGSWSPAAQPPRQGRTSGTTRAPTSPAYSTGCVAGSTTAPRKPKA